MLEIVRFMYLWCLDIVSFVLVNREFGWSHHTSIDFCSHMREVCG